MTPGFAAVVEQGDRGAIAAALDRGAAVDARGADGTTALHWAVHADNLPIVQSLLEAGADSGAVDRYGITPLYLAAVNANPAVLTALLDAGADIAAAAPTGETTLMTATRTGRIDALELLLARGALVDARDPEFQQTALMLAVREDHPAAVVAFDRARRGRGRSDTRRRDAVVHAAVQGHGLRIRRRRHQSWRAARSRSARRRAGRHDAASVRRP